MFIASIFFFHITDKARGGDFCLGIFEDKVTCQARYRYERDRNLCIEKSWEQCVRIKPKKIEYNAQYEACLDRERCSCMRKLGNECLAESIIGGDE